MIALPFAQEIPATVSLPVTPWARARLNQLLPSPPRPAIVRAGSHLRRPLGSAMVSASSGAASNAAISSRRPHSEKASAADAPSADFARNARTSPSACRRSSPTSPRSAQDPGPPRHRPGACRTARSGTAARGLASSSSTSRSSSMTPFMRSMPASSTKAAQVYARNTPARLRR